MNKQLLDEALKIQGIVYDRDMLEEDKLEVFCEFLADGSRIKQVLFLDILYSATLCQLPDYHRKVFNFILPLQKKGLLPWDLIKLNRLCALNRPTHGRYHRRCVKQYVLLQCRQH